jgi:hypothetical protein
LTIIALKFNILMILSAFPNLDDNVLFKNRIKRNTSKKILELLNSIIGIFREI